MWKVNWPSNGGQLQQKRGSRTGRGPRIAYCRQRAFQLERGVAHTRVWSETQGFLNLRLKWSAKLLRPALEMGHRAAQIRVWNGTRGCSDPCLRWDAGFLRPASDAELLRLALNAVYSGPRLKSLCLFEREVSILVEMQPSRWNKARVWCLILSDF